MQFYLGYSHFLNLITRVINSIGERVSKQVMICRHKDCRIGRIQNFTHNVKSILNVGSFLGNATNIQQLQSYETKLFFYVSYKLEGYIGCASTSLRSLTVETGDKRSRLLISLVSRWDRQGQSCLDFLMFLFCRFPYFAVGAALVLPPPMSRARRYLIRVIFTIITTYRFLCTVQLVQPCNLR